jgi:hypothetical protein
MKRTGVLVFTVGLGLGYILGTRAGREQYDRLVAGARRVWDDPRVSRARHDAQAYAKAQAPVVAAKAEQIARSVPGHVTDGVQKAAETVAAAAGHTTVIAHDVAGRTTIIAKDAASKAASAVTAVAGTVTGADV